MSTAPIPDFVAAAARIEAEVTELRHELHQHPELGTDLPWTQARVLTALEGLPLQITEGTLSTSINAVLRGGAAPADIADRPVILLRADMDALPLQEETGMAFASRIPGRMHACGHDVHTATLVGAARVLSAHAADLPGDIVFMFQTSEEDVKGALLQIRDGVLDAAGTRVDAAFGLHVMSATLSTGMYTTAGGTVMAGADRLFVDIIGTGGHGSAPHLANDPVPVMGEVIMAMQTLPARKFDAFDPVVVTIGVANAGAAANVIPERCHLEMSLRTFSAAHRVKMEQVIQEVIHGICAAHGTRAEITYERGVGPTVNDERWADFARDQVTDLLGGERFQPLAQPYAGSEDFSEVLNEVPGCFMFYSGVRPGKDPADCTYNHSATAWFDDSVIRDAVAVYARLGWSALAELASR
ncbi:MAG TPA: amidohydrolase [Propionibacterium sp.]|nr:amidohydrolase [Propionibacterium sp.]